MRWRVLISVLLAVLAAAVARAAAPSHSISPHVLADLRMAPQCFGQQRWKIKTLADDEANTVEFGNVQTISVKKLRQKGKPAGASTATRIQPVETTVYKVRVQLVEARWIWDRSESKPLKEKGDRDIHLVISDPSDEKLQMIVEFPDPACVDAAQSLKATMRNARNAFLDCKGRMPSADRPFQKLSGTATISGVGFFDRPHATGHAPSGIELHPVLSFRRLSS